MENTFKQCNVKHTENISRKKKKIIFLAYYLKEEPIFLRVKVPKITIFTNLALWAELF